jgi:hypothetical protein
MHDCNAPLFIMYKFLIYFLFALVAATTSSANIEIAKKLDQSALRACDSLVAEEEKKVERIMQLKADNLPPLPLPCKDHNEKLLAAYDKLVPPLTHLLAIHVSTRSFLASEMNELIEGLKSFREAFMEIFKIYNNKRYKQAIFRRFRLIGGNEKKQTDKIDRIYGLLPQINWTNVYLTNVYRWLYCLIADLTEADIKQFVEKTQFIVHVYDSLLNDQCDNTQHAQALYGAWIQEWDINQKENPTPGPNPRDAIMDPPYNQIVLEWWGTETKRVQAAPSQPIKHKKKKK